MKVTSASPVNERFAFLTVAKQGKVIHKTTPTAVKVFKNEKKQGKLSIINVRTPPHGKNILPKISLNDIFYDDLQKNIKGSQYLTLTWLDSISTKIVKNNFSCFLMPLLEKVILIPILVSE